MEKAECGQDESFSTTAKWNALEFYIYASCPVILLVSVGIDRVDKIDMGADTRVDLTRTGKLKSITARMYVPLHVPLPLT